jgi:choline dehydrogenase-like flavoprotein
VLADLERGVEVGAELAKPDEVPGTTLADWPISYDDLEPYYTMVEWAFGVSGQAGANAYEGWRSKGYPCPPMPQSRYAEKFHQGCAELGWNSFPTPQAALSRPLNDRPATVISAFAQQHGDPSGTRSSALNVFIPYAVATGRFDLRPESYVRELVVDGRGRVRAAVYLDSDGHTVEQEADVFVLAGGAIEFADPINAWAGGGYVSASSFEFYHHDSSRDFVSGGHIAAAGVGIPLPINWHLPGRPTWGAEAKQIDRELFNHSMAVAMVLHDMPQHDNRVDLDPSVTDAWGFPVARITLKTHENDLAQGRFLVDRCGEILEASGAKTVDKVYPTRVTGNCSHQHGTTRMGTDPDTSVLNATCRAHEVQNLFVVDGGPLPTATGANPTLTMMANAWRVADHIMAGGQA